MIINFFNLSFKYKIPLWGSLLIILTTFSISLVLIYRSYNILENTLLNSAQNLGFTIAQTLAPTLLHDDIWRAFEIVKAPFHNIPSNHSGALESVFVLSIEHQILVSSQPKKLPMLSPVNQFFPELDKKLNQVHNQIITIIEPSSSKQLFVVIPVIDNNKQLATLVLNYSQESLNKPFFQSVISTLIICFIVLLILLPINWYWGQHMALPLVQLAKKMDSIPSFLPKKDEIDHYNYDDELGHLFDAYYRMLDSLHEKELLEQGIIKSERLAVVGRLTASIAHEINNPLAGMLTALDTLKQRGNLDDRTLHTLGLLERGLLQVRDTVAALLVEARHQKRNLSKQDVDDIKNLIKPMANKANLRLEININVPPTLPVPAGSIRQILMNLINNAIQSANTNGLISYSVIFDNNHLIIDVINSGSCISAEQMHHLFEPFVSYHEGGHGLGLWVTYQLVNQMEGKIEVESSDNQVRFTVTIPINSSSNER